MIITNRLNLMADVLRMILIEVLFMIVITFLNWVSSLLYGTQLDMSSIVMSFDILTEAIGFIGYFIPMGPVVVIFTVLNLTYSYRLIVSVLKLLWSIIPLL